NRRPMAHALLWRAQLPARIDRFAAVLKYVVEELEIVACELIAALFRLPLRKRRLAAEPFLHILAAALDYVRNELLAVRLALQRRVEKAKQRTKAFLDTAVRRGGDKDDMTGAVLREIAQKLVALMLKAHIAAARTCRDVSFVHNNEVGRIAQKRV